VRGIKISTRSLLPENFSGIQKEEKNVPRGTFGGGEWQFFRKNSDFANLPKKLCHTRFYPSTHINYYAYSLKQFLGEVLKAVFLRFRTKNCGVLVFPYAAKEKNYLPNDFT